jgi:hypothetical protein
MAVVNRNITALRPIGVYVNVVVVVPGAWRVSGSGVT